MSEATGNDEDLVAGGSAPEAAFVDKGREIDIHAWRERASVLAALQLAEQKWESFDVSGRAQFKALCVELAVEHGFKINNPELQAQIAQEKQRQLEARAMPRPAETSPTPPSQSRTEAPAAPLSQSHERSAKAYARHYRDVVQRQAGKVTDLSRVDAMIAVRMRATGHTQQQVESALRLCAPMMHPKTETRDWSNYAQRTAAYAFGAAGQRQGEELKKYWDQWQRLEARPEEPVQERGRGRSR